MGTAPLFHRWVHTQRPNPRSKCGKSSIEVGREGTLGRIQGTANPLGSREASPTRDTEISRARSTARVLWDQWDISTAQ